MTLKELNQLKVLLAKLRDETFRAKQGNYNGEAEVGYGVARSAYFLVLNQTPEAEDEDGSI